MSSDVPRGAAQGAVDAQVGLRLIEEWSEIAADMAMRCANEASLFDRKKEDAWDRAHQAIEAARNV